jgi:HlyD family secretion protein
MSIGRLVMIILGLLVAGAIVAALWPKAVGVDVARVDRTDMVVTVDEDGRTRVRERYVVASPLPAQLLRIELKAGDPVEMGKTVLAVLEPNESELLDVRTQMEAEARVRSATAALEQTKPRTKKASAALEIAQLELKRLQNAAATQAASAIELERAASVERIASAELEAAQFQERIAQFELEQAEAALARSRPPAGAPTDLARFEVKSPVSGRVLRVMHESGAPVMAGTALLEVGDPSDLEVEVDVLSADAVRIPPRARVMLERWGGDFPLRGEVRLVEPSGFTKISALGVEEQRVNVIVDLLDPVEKRPSLGDEYRVEARIVVWEGHGVVAVPLGAVFRHGDGWAVFVVKDGRAALRPVTIEHRNQTMAEITGGINEGDEVVLHPSDKVRDGVRLAKR